MRPGIIVAGIDENSRGYVLDDLSGRYPPDRMGKGRDRRLSQPLTPTALWRRSTTGGDMVGSDPARRFDQDVSFRAVHAEPRKVARAEPVARCTGKAGPSSIGAFTQLEDQMAGFVRQF
jgi:phage terminase large subunit-like protein